MISMFALSSRICVLVALIIAAAGAQTDSDTPDFGLSNDGGLETEGPAPPSNALDKEDLEIYLRHLYIWPPEYKVEIGDFEPSPIEGLLQTDVTVSYKLAGQRKVFFISEDGKHILDGTPYTISENPFTDSIEKIDTTEAPGFGTPGAPVVLVVYSDFQCPYCAKEAKMLRTQLLSEYPEEVRVYYRDLPLPKHKWAMAAAIAGQCIYQNDPEVYWQYFDWIFENQKSFTPENLNDKVRAFLADKKIDTLKVSQCIAGNETEPKVKASMNEAAKLGIRSTPAVVINGRKVGSVKWARLKQIIENEIDYQKIAHDAGDDCGCEISPQLPGLQ